MTVGSPAGERDGAVESGEALPTGAEEVAVGVESEGFVLVQLARAGARITATTVGRRAGRAERLVTVATLRRGVGSRGGVRRSVSGGLGADLVESVIEANGCTA